MFTEEWIQLITAAGSLIALGAVGTWAVVRLRLGGFQNIGAAIIAKAEADANAKRKQDELTLKQRELEATRELEKLTREERQKLQREEERLKIREDKLEHRLHALEKKILEVDRRDTALNVDKKACEALTDQLARANKQLLEQLERISGLTTIEAKDLLLQRIHNDVETEIANLSRRKLAEAEEIADRKAASVVVTAINRLCVPCVSEVTVTTVSLPSDEMKGRIIGREGRNIRLLERELGVNILVDDTPGAVVLSGFDPIRKQIAKLVISELVSDGRIHPTRIQEVIEQKRTEVEKLNRKYGEDAAMRVGALDMHPALMALLGQLKLRFSYGQNILDHSLEVANILGMMAAELGLDARLAKRIGLLHDVGKAVSHETEGSHALVGRDLAIRYGESVEVANGIGCHHYEIEATTVEGSLCNAADAISASRPGARSGAIEEYVKRLKDLEEITHDFPGVERAYALQAGREIHISVLPEVVDDAGVVNLARDIGKRIEQKLKYPGRIKITVVREKRVVEYAG